MQQHIKEIQCATTGAHNKKNTVPAGRHHVSFTGRTRAVEKSAIVPFANDLNLAAFAWED
jgi:hypothetical protein